MTAKALHNGYEIVLEEYFPSDYWAKRDLEWEVEKYFKELCADPFRMSVYGMYKDPEKIGICILDKPKISDYAFLPFKFLLFIAMGIVLIPFYTLRNFVDWIFNGPEMEHFMAQIILAVAVPLIGMYLAQPYIEQGFDNLAQTVKMIHDARVQLGSLGSL
jgi:hypothetical protein